MRAIAVALIEKIVKSISDTVESVIFVTIFCLRKFWQYFSLSLLYCTIFLNTKTWMYACINFFNVGQILMNEKKKQK